MLARVTAIVIGALSLAAAASASPPLGGDDAGFLPPDGAAKRCSERVQDRSLGKGRLLQCILKCQLKAATVSFKDASPYVDEPCEVACLQKFEAVRFPDDCPTCLDATARGDLADDLLTFANDINGSLFCAGMTPFGGDDGGYVPPPVRR